MGVGTEWAGTAPQLAVRSSPVLFFQGQNIPGSRWKSSVHGEENQLHHRDVHCGQRPDAVVCRALQVRVRFVEHFSQWTGSKRRPYVHSPIDRCVLVTFPFILYSVLLSSSSSCQTSKCKVWNVEELACSGVLVGARVGNTPQHHLQHFYQQVWWLFSVCVTSQRTFYHRSPCKTSLSPEKTEPGCCWLSKMLKP